MTCVMQFCELLRNNARNERCFGKKRFGEIQWPGSMIKNPKQADVRHTKAGNECILGDVFTVNGAIEENERVKVMMGRIK